jgi:uncharacterized protein with GYD domain
MPTFVVLANLTEQGIRNIKESPQRAGAAQELAKKFGCTFKALYWTQGQFDQVAVIEAPDEQTMSAFVLSVANAGNVQGQTLRAFDSAEFGAILKKMG